MLTSFELTINEQLVVAADEADPTQIVGSLRAAATFIEKFGLEGALERLRSLPALGRMVGRFPDESSAMETVSNNPAQ